MKREANRRIPDVTQDRMLNVTGSEGGVSHHFKQRCHNPISSYFPHSSWVAQDNRTFARRSREIGEDESDPPRKAWGHVAPIAVLCHMSLSGPMRGRSRPHSSLREGSEQPPRWAAKTTEMDL